MMSSQHHQVPRLGRSSTPAASAFPHSYRPTHSPAAKGCTSRLARARIFAQAQRIHDRVSEQQLLKQKLEMRNAGSLILSGPGNCGKTTLLTQVLEDLRRDHPDAVILVLDGRKGHLVNPTTMMQTIQKQVRSLPEAARAALGIFQGSKIRASLPRPLQKLFGFDAQLELSLSQDLAEVGVVGFLQAFSRRLELGTKGTIPPLLVIDEANMMQLWATDDKTQDERITIMNFFIDLTKVKECCNIVMATSEFSFVGWIKTELKSNTRDLMLGYFREDDAKTFLQQLLLQQPDSAVVNGIWDHWDQVYEVCGGSPMLLKLFAESFSQLKGDFNAALRRVWEPLFEEVDGAARKGGPGFTAEAYRKVASGMAGTAAERQGAVLWPQLEDEVKGSGALEAMLEANVICYRVPSEMALDFNESVYMDGNVRRPVATAPSPAHLFAMRILKQDGRL